MRRWLSLSLLGLCLQLGPQHAAAQAAVELAARLDALERVEGLDDSVQRPLTLARAALMRAEAASARGDASAQARARELALAALELAEARLQLLRERALLKAAEARRVLSERERESAEQALTRERARLLELQKAAAAP